MSRLRLRLLVILLCLPLMACLRALGQYDPSQIMNAWQTRQPGLTLVGSHRGEINGAFGNNMPENSLSALRNAVDAGNEIVEMDIYTTQDHVPYLMHDKTLYRMLRLNQPSAYNPDPNGNPAAEWSAIRGMPLCGSRGITDVTVGGTGQCQFNYGPVEYVPSLVDLANAVRLAQNQQGQAWGGVIILDIRDVDGLVQSWSTLMQLGQLGLLSQQVVFKCSPLRLGAFSPKDIANLLATSSHYNGNATQAAADMQLYMNLQPYYVGNLALQQEKATGNPNWAIDDWNNWLNSAGSFHRLISAEVDVKGSPGELLTADPLFGTVQAGQLNTVGVYSTYFDCDNPSGPQNLPNLPLGAAGLNGYWTTDGKCVSLNPSVEESADSIDHRYDYNFITGRPTSTIQDPPNFGMILADTAGVLINYLQGIGQRNMLRAIQPHCNSGSEYPGCDGNGQTTYTLCAPEGGTCTFAGDRNVVFGANGAYTNPVTFTNSVACNNATLGPDPIEGVVKACYTSPAISNYPINDGSPSYYLIYCADQGQACNWTEPVSGSFSVISANGKYVADFGGGPWTLPGYLCQPSSFAHNNPPGDPAPGFTKACFYEPHEQYLVFHSGPSGYAFCAGEGGTCSFNGLGRVQFGRYSSFNTGVFNGGVACNTSVFGDPIPGYTKDCWYEATTAASSVTGTGNGSGTSTCDIYASGGTPCVAAHSMVRALFGGYSGRLYQVKRASDGTTIDIGTLTAGGYANAASQDSFCTGTTCAITIIYDQTSNHNDLPVTPGDSLAVANALPISANGNEAYGLQVTPGVGYRNNATRGVATGASPEGIYMVTSGTFVNNGCCFDYGNAEANSQDNHEGHMDALNFGTACQEYPPCSGSGPWVEADLEDGQYMGNGSNLGDQSVNSDFVTAMSENNGTSTFALYAGNAQSGGLTTEYSGTLPTVKSGYIPMNLEGAIVLGTGGDNSNSGQGSFFEGAMVSGYPSAATESAVQANIVAAGYTGDSSGGSAGSGGSTPTDPAGTYTGPSDPGGPGPQDGFASPATEQPNDIMATKPALASFNGSLYVAFEGVNVDSNALYVASSSTGYNFPQATPYGNLQSSSAPAMAAFNGQLFIAFRGVNVNNALYVTSSPTGNNFPTATGHGNILMGGAPALAEFNYRLCAAFKANDASNLLYVTCSSDGVTWPTATGIPNVWLGSDPAMASFNGKLYIAYRANDSSRNVWIASSSDGVNFSNQQLTGQTMGGSSSPALVVSNGVLYYIYGANDQGHEMLVSASTDGSTWQGPAAYLGVQMGATGPGAAAFGTGISAGFQSNDSRNVLFVTNKVTEAANYTGPSDPGGPGPQDGLASPATEQPNDIMATKPAFAAFQGQLYVAFEGVNTNSNALYITSTRNANNFPQATAYGNLQSSSAPAMATYGNSLYVAFRGVNVNNAFYVTSSPTGTNFPQATGYGNIQMGGAPALAVFNNYLCAGFKSNDPSDILYVTCSGDGGVTWPNATGIPNVRLGSDPAMASFNGKLYIAYRADDPSNNVWIASSSDGVNFSNQMLGQTMGGSSSPALVVSNCTLYYIYGANDQGNEMMVMSSSDGSTWHGPKAYMGVQMGAAGPGAAAFQHGVSVGFQSNDARNVLFMSNGADGTAIPSGGCQAVITGTLSTGTLLGSANPSNLPTPYPRLARLPNGNIVASANGIIYRSTDGGKTFNYLDTVPTISGSYQVSETGLWMVPQNVGSLTTGTLLYAGTYSTVTPPAQVFVIEIYASTDGGETWHYLSTPVQGSSAHGVWEPEFGVDNYGHLVMFWSDETDPCCSQKIAQMDSTDGIHWADQTNTVASNINADRPGMSVVSQLPNPLFFMSYEDCGPAACTVFTRTSTDGWNFGTPSTILSASIATTATGQYFQHTPTNVWSPSPHDANGEILLIGQVLLESNGQVSPENGTEIFVSSLTNNGYGPWFPLTAPVQTPDAYPNPCPNWSSALLPSLDGTSLLEVASDYNNVGVCETYFATGATDF